MSQNKKKLIEKLNLASKECKKLMEQKSVSWLRSLQKIDALECLWMNGNFYFKVRLVNIAWMLDAWDCR